MNDGNSGKTVVIIKVANDEMRDRLFALIWTQTGVQSGLKSPVHQ